MNDGSTEPCHLIGPSGLPTYIRQGVRDIKWTGDQAQPKAEIYVGWLLVDSSRIQTLAYVDPEGGISQCWGGEINYMSLRGSEYRGRAAQMLLEVGPRDWRYWQLLDMADLVKLAHVTHHLAARRSGG